MNNENKIYLSWKWVDDQLNLIGDQLERLDDIEFISGIPRGGLIPAVMMSHSFGIKYIGYSSAKQLPLELRKKTIVIDDIADTGVTLKEAVSLDFITCTLAMRATSKVNPNFIGQFISGEEWLVFPWECLDSVPVQDYLIEDEQ
tara:strand:- start:804 stop:1235 length:432 start_codon:yes stop_codon:yes gene_type:complete